MIVNSTLVARTRSIEFTTSETLRNEQVDVESFSTNFVIDVDGNIYKLSDGSEDSTTVTIVGGLDTFANEKIYREPLPYLTQMQKNAIYSILKQMASFTDQGEVSCTNDSIIDEFVQSVYFNFCG